MAVLIPDEYKSDSRANKKQEIVNGMSGCLSTTLYSARATVKPKKKTSDECLARLVQKRSSSQRTINRRWSATPSYYRIRASATVETKQKLSKERLAPE